MHLPDSFEMATDLPDLPDVPYNFPSVITPTDLRPDIVIWSQTLQSATLVELTVCYETNYVQAQTRKCRAHLQPHLGRILILEFTCCCK